jgi:hypothetical protein
LKEEDLYSPVADFVRKEFNCFFVGIKKGTELGTIDIVGLRYVMGDIGGSSEVISVEVKPEEMAFLKCEGKSCEMQFRSGIPLIKCQKRQKGPEVSGISGIYTSSPR